MEDGNTLPTWAIVVIILSALLGTIIICLLLYRFCCVYVKQLRRNKFAEEYHFDHIELDPSLKRYERAPFHDSGRFNQDRQFDKIGRGQHNTLGRPMPSTVDIIPIGESAEPLQPLDWPPPSPPPAIEI